MSRRELFAGWRPSSVSVEEEGRVRMMQELKKAGALEEARYLAEVSAQGEMNRLVAAGMNQWDAWQMAKRRLALFTEGF